MDEGSRYISIIVVLVLVDAIITLGYSALQHARQSDLQEQAENGQTASKTALLLLDAQAKLNITYRLAATIIISTIVLLSTMWLVFGDLQLNFSLSIGLVFLISFVSLIFGTIIPEAIGSTYAMTFAPMLAAPMHLLNLVLSPLTSILQGISALLVRASGNEQSGNAITELEIMTLVDAGNTGGTIEDEEREMIFSILQLDQTFAREIMIPRIDIEAVDVSTTLKDALDTFMRTGYSRIPVYEENVDNIVGVLYAKDLLNMWHNGGLDGHTARDLVRSAYFIPEILAAHDLLRDLQARNVHMAIVVDEYGGTSGLVTIENIMEEIVGDIRDEYDLNEENEYIQHKDDEFVIDGGMDIDDVNELLSSNISAVDSDTLGGFIFLQIGRVPIVGEVIETDEVQLTVRSIEGRRIRKVLVKVKPKLEAELDENIENDTTELADAP